MDQKAAIFERCLVERVPISDLCDEYGIRPNQIYARQRILFDSAPAAFHPVAKREAKRLSVQEEVFAESQVVLEVSFADIVAVLEQAAKRLLV
jgi:transposase